MASVFQFEQFGGRIRLVSEEDFRSLMADEVDNFQVRRALGSRFGCFLFWFGGFCWEKGVLFLGVFVVLFEVFML